MIEKAFNNWWDSDIDTTDNPFLEGTPAFWAHEGWKAGQANPPEGWKLVPIEPTVEMRELLCDCYDNLPQIEIYRQMLDAAPTPGKDKE